MAAHDLTRSSGRLGTTRSLSRASVPTSGAIWSAANLPLPRSLPTRLSLSVYSPFLTDLDRRGLTGVCPQRYHQKPPPAGHRAPPAEGRLGRAATSPHHDIPPTVLLLLPLPDPVPSSSFPSVVDGIRPLRRRDGHHPRRDAAVVSFL